MSDIESALDMALDEMPDDFVIKKFVMSHRAEIKEMFLAEYYEEEILKQETEEEINKARIHVVADMLKKNLPLQLIEEVTQFSEDEIKGIALDLGLNIAN